MGRWSRKLPFEPGARVRPVPFDRADRHAQVFGDLRAGHAREKPEADDLGGAGIDRLEARQRRFQGQEVLDRHRAGGRRLEQRLEHQRLHTAAAFVALLVTPVIDQQPSHRDGAECEAVRSPLHVGSPVVLQPEPGLMDERRRLQRVIPPFTLQITAGDTSQLSVNLGKELVV